MTHIHDDMAAEIARLQSKVTALELANERLHERLALEGESRDAEIARLLDVVRFVNSYMSREGGTTGGDRGDALYVMRSALANRGAA